MEGKITGKFAPLGDGPHKTTHFVGLRRARIGTERSVPPQVRSPNNGRRQDERRRKRQVESPQLRPIIRFIVFVFQVAPLTARIRRSRLADASQNEIWQEKNWDAASARSFAEHSLPRYG
jgi:hypothetical protein